MGEVAANGNTLAGIGNLLAGIQADELLRLRHTDTALADKLVDLIHLVREIRTGEFEDEEDTRPLEDFVDQFRDFVTRLSDEGTVSPKILKLANTASLSLIAKLLEIVKLQQNRLSNAGDTNGALASTLRDVRGSYGGPNPW